MTQSKYHTNGSKITVCHTQEDADAGVTVTAHSIAVETMRAFDNAKKYPSYPSPGNIYWAHHLRR